MLRQAGPAVWPKLAELVVRGPGDSAQRAGALLGFSNVTDKVRLLVAHLRHEDPHRRRGIAKVLARRSRDVAAPVMPPLMRVLATMLYDPDPRVVATAVAAFADIGPQAIPILQEVRRSAHRSRRAALAALAEIGWDTIAPTDARALARLIAGKLHAEIPHRSTPTASGMRCAPTTATPCCARSICPIPCPSRCTPDSHAGARTDSLTARPFKMTSYSTATVSALRCSSHPYSTAGHWFSARQKG